MKKIKLTMVFILGIGAMIFTQSCEKETSDNKVNESSCGKTNISKSGSDESHNNDQNCMSCHTNGGSGEGCFSLAGTAYKSDKTTVTNTGSVKLYTEANGGGTLKHTVAIDAEGNFHTTENIDMSGLFPAISLGDTQHYMSTAPGNGSCNTCHGVSTDKLWGE